MGTGPSVMKRCDDNGGNPSDAWGCHGRNSNDHSEIASLTLHYQQFSVATHCSLSDSICDLSHARWQSSHALNEGESVQKTN